ncbi:hypothetical protein [Kocuria palustris]|uniref:hypothetical protein n=1 Tax=Kocuria palustris TaxID=71999 RepID=UPI00119FE6C2|nr:hypothetical protein [Kocuria palustris]
MMTDRSTAPVTVLMRMDDTAGRPIEIERDVLRRAYIALQGLGRQIFAQCRPAERVAAESLSMSFVEPGPGEVVFELEIAQDRPRRSPEHRPDRTRGAIVPVSSQNRALQLTAQTLVEIVRTVSFLLAARQTAREVHEDHIDLIDADTGRRTRVSPHVDRGLRQDLFTHEVREFLSGLTRDGVGAVSLAIGGRLQRSQIQHPVIATDRSLAFASGTPLPLPLDAPADPDARASPPGAA